MDKKGDSPPALVINVQSWATPILALLFLIVGLFLGYAGRPSLESRLQAGKPAPTAVAAVGEAPAAAVGEPPAAAAATTDIMEFLAKDLRHVKGDPNAKVLIIEFSDYQ